MKARELWRMSVRNVAASPVRSGLTVLGMAIGIGAILAVLTLGDAGKAQVRSEMSRLGIDRVWLTAGEGEPLRHGDARLLAETLNTLVTEQVYAPVRVRHERVEADGVAVGCSPDYLRSMDTRVLAGRSLYPLEWRADSRSVLMGRELALALGAEPGDRVVAGGQVFTLAGVVEQRNEMAQVDAGSAVFVPIDALCGLMGQSVHELTLVVPQGLKPQALAAMAGDVMRLRRGVDAQTVTMQVQLEAANSVIAIFVDVLKWVAAICTMVGGIGVMNILLVGVRERRREIGMMQAMGASGALVCALFLMEAAVYAISGGLSGLLLGVALIETAGRSIGLYPVIRAEDCATVLLAAVLLGLICGVAPASRAARMRPVDALREE